MMEDSKLGYGCKGIKKGDFYVLGADGVYTVLSYVTGEYQSFKNLKMRRKKTRCC
jgi:hypothetical protein